MREDGGSNPGPVKLNTVSQTARHRCDESSEPRLSRGEESATRDTLRRNTASVIKT